MHKPRIDFTSAHYLGIRHRSADLGHWSELSSGHPAVLGQPPGAKQLAQRVARLQGLNAGIAGASTLHLFHDLLSWLAERRGRFFLDEHAYPIASWALCATPQNHLAERFPHQDTHQLAAQFRRQLRVGERPVILTDGYCPTCGRLAPLRALSELAREHAGYLVVDSTQGLGLLGARPSRSDPLGADGGGVLRHQDLHGPHVVSIASLTKSFSAPVAVLAGPGRLVEQLSALGSQVHSSPPTTVVLRAAMRALQLNERIGVTLRRRLVQRVTQLRCSLRNLPWVGGSFPLQLLRFGDGLTAERVHERLHARGVTALLLKGHDGTPQIGLAISSSHSKGDIDTLSMVLKDLTRVRPVRCTPAERRLFRLAGCLNPVYDTQGSGRYGDRG